MNKLTITLSLWLATMLSVGGQTTPDVNAYGTNSSIMDMIAIYYAGGNRLKWTQDNWAPYVTHTFMDGHTEWLFQGFMLLDLEANGKQTLHVNKNVNYATKNDWQTLIDMPFASGKMLDALDKTISYYRKKLGAPPFRHKVVMSVPTPIKNQKDWGRIGNQRLDFSKDADRIKAMKWFIDEFLKTYSKNHYENFDLEGFYWLEEDMANTRGLAAQISSYLHQLGYKHYWMPYLKANGSTDWQKCGFDQCYTQPGGYCFNIDRDESRVVNACEKAKRRGMGLVMEFDAHVFTDPDNFVPRINRCIDIFDQQGVYENAAMSYYDSAKMIYCISQGKFSKITLTGKRLTSVQQLMDRMSQIIVNRWKRHFSTSTPSYSEPASTPQETPKRDSDDWRNPDYWHF